MIAWRIIAKVIQSFLLPYLFPIKAAPASGTALNKHSSQNPACKDIPTADNHGNGVAIISGENNVEVGTHQPKYDDVIK